MEVGRPVSAADLLPPLERLLSRKLNDVLWRQVRRWKHFHLAGQRLLGRTACQPDILDGDARRTFHLDPHLIPNPVVASVPAGAQRFRHRQRRGELDRLPLGEPHELLRVGGTKGDLQARVATDGSVQVRLNEIAQKSDDVQEGRFPARVGSYQNLKGTPGPGRRSAGNDSRGTRREGSLAWLAMAWYRQGCSSAVLRSGSRVLGSRGPPSAGAARTAGHRGL